MPMVTLSFSVFGPALAICVLAGVGEYSQVGFCSGNSTGLQEGTSAEHSTAGSAGFKALGASSSSRLCTRCDTVCNYTFSAGTRPHLVHVTAELRGGLRHRSKLNLNNLNLQFKYLKNFDVSVEFL